MPTVALDIGNTCISLRYAECARAFGLDPEKPIPSDIDAMCGKYSRGLVSTVDWLEFMRTRFPSGTPDRTVFDAWNSVLGPVFPGMTETITHFASLGFRFVFFSDTTEVHMAYLRRELPFAHLVTGAILSYEVHACKPDSAMYEAFERAYGVPDFYFDDLEKNISGAAARGWNAVRFTSPEYFATVLAQKTV